MTEYTKIMEAKYSSAVKMGGIDQNPLVEFSLNGPPEQQSEEKQEMLSQEHFCGRTKRAFGAGVPGWQRHTPHLSRFSLDSSVGNPPVKPHAAYKCPWEGKPFLCYRDRVWLSSK